MNIEQDKIANPLNYYTLPSEVDADKNLSLDQKITLLKNWLDDIHLRQTAEAENMRAPENGRTYIAEVERLLQQYQAEKNAQK